MTLPYSTDDFLVRVREEAQLPDAGDFDDARLLRLGDKAMRSIIEDRVKSQRGEHWVRYLDTAMPTTSSQSLAPIAFDIPRRALGRMLRSVSMINASGGPIPLSEVDPTMVGTAWIPPGTFRFRADKLDVAPAPGATLRLGYLRQPSRLVTVASCAAIASSASPLALLLQAAWTTQPPMKALCDIILGDAPFESLYDDLLVNGITSTAVTLASTSPIDSSLIPDASLSGQMAAMLCRRDTTCFPPIPTELFPALVSWVVARVLEALGDRTGMAVASEDYKRLASAGQDIISPRSEQGNRLMISRSSPLRSQPFGWRKSR